MSSMRNSLHRRNHKERSQPAHRAKLGVLEKHKDYVLRARDYHAKQDRLHRLKLKSADRNKDEFYFGMVHKRTQRGVNVYEGGESLTADIAKVLKTQDENYIRSMRLLNLKKIDRLKAQLTSLANLFGAADVGDGLSEEDMKVLEKAGIYSSSKKAGSKHIVFVDNDEDAQQYKADLEGLEDDSDISSVDSDEDDVDLGWKKPEEKKSKGKAKLKTSNPAELSKMNQKEATKHRARLLREIAARLTRDTHLRYAERELEMQRLLLGKGSAKKIRGAERVKAEKGQGSDEDDDEDGSQKSNQVYKPKIHKWRFERKR